MKNILSLLATFLRNGLMHLATAMFVLLALANTSNAGVHKFDKQTITVQAFTKTVSRICDKVTYNIHVYILTQGGPTNVIISDVLPAGLKPPGSITFTGNTSGAPATFVNSNSWSAQFDTPAGSGSVATSYTISFTTTIDPAALTGGDFQLVNRARIAIGPKSSPDYENSDDPAKPGQEDKTVIDIPVAEVKKCLGDQTGNNNTAPPVNSCFSPDIKVVCGQKPGTFDITLNAQSSNGVMPSSVTITPTTAGVSIVNAQATYPVVAGQVKITVAGANPGDVLTFAVDGTTAGGGSVAGTDLCCTGTLTITIPKDLNCNITPELEVTKSCLPAKPNDKGGFSAKCTIKVKSTGAFTTPVNISETLVGNGTVKYLSATDPWTCAPLTVPGNTPMNCQLPGNTLNPITDVSYIDVSVDFSNAGDVKEAKNCVQRMASASQGGPGKKHCVLFTIDDSKIDITKECGPASYRKYPAGPAATGIGFVADCKITVTTTGPQSGTISVSDTLTGGGTIINATAPAPWYCSVSGATAGCSANGTLLNQTTSTTVINASVVFPTSGSASEGLNCATVKVNGRAKDRDCVPIKVDSGTLTVVKEAFVNGTRYTTQSFDTKVTCGGNVVATSIQDGAAPYVQNNIPIGTSCTVDEGNNIATPAGFCKEGSTAAWNVSYSPASPVVIGAGNTTVVVTNKLVCNPPPPNGDIKVTKVCDPAKPKVGPVLGPYEAICHITVTTTGAQSGTINVNDVITGVSGVNVTSMTNASSNAPMWSCSGTSCNISGGSLNQTTSTSVFDAAVTFPTSGHALESQNCAVLNVGGADVGKDCVPFTVDKEVGSLTVLKQAFDLEGQRLPGLMFPANVTCGSTVTPINVAEDSPYTQNNISVGTSCSVVETTSTPPANLCPKGSVASWVATYNPTAPVTITTAGATITITNKVQCDEVSDERVTTFSVRKEATFNGNPITNVNFPINVSCANGVTQSYNLAGGAGETINGLPDGTTCTVSEGAIANTGLCPKGTTENWSTSYSPASASNTTSTQSSVLVTVRNVLNCKDNPPPVQQIVVKKVVESNAPGSVAGLVFPITSTCTPNTPSSNSPMTVGMQGGNSGIIFGGALGDTCTITEGTIPATNACGPNAKPVWTTSYSPSQTITVAATNPTITVKNILNCEEIVKTKLTTFSVRKEATYNGNPITNVNFQINVNCANGVTQNYTLTGGQGETINDLPDGTTCTVSEGKIGNTGLCPKGTTESWSTTYNPASASNTTSTLASVIVTVRNLLNCRPIIIDNPLPKCDLKTTNLVGNKCVCKFRGWTQVSSTSCKSPPPPPKCKSDERLVNGVCIERPVLCDRGYRRTADNKCVLIQLDCGRNEVQKGTRCVFVQPDCPDGTVWNGKRCVQKQKICPPPLKLNKATNTCFMPRPDCGPGERYNAKRNRCDKVVIPCPRGTKRQGNECVPIKARDEQCRRGFMKLGKACVPIARNCPFGTIPTPLGCIRIGGGRDDDRKSDNCKNEDGFPIPCP